MTDPAISAIAPCRVLVVDPDDRIRESLARLLPIGGRCVVVGSAADSEAALVLAASMRPDLVMLDSRLVEEAAAQDFIGRVRAVADDVRIVILSMSDATEPPALPGADASIRKTFRPHELVDAVLHAARTSAG
jgi:DNA-binding NarL/FixJ family response regulator